MQTINLDYEGIWVLNVKVISLPYIFQVLYVLCFTRPRYQVSVYRTIGPLVLFNPPVNNFSVMLGRSHRFLSINQYFGKLKVSAQGHYPEVVGFKSGPLAPASDALPLSHRAPTNDKNRT